MNDPGYSKGYAAGIRRATRTVLRLRAEVSKLRALLATGGQLARDVSGAWVCPWGICNPAEAQECRAERNPRKGCGGRFPAGTTFEQAKEMIGAPCGCVAGECGKEEKRG